MEHKPYHLTTPLMSGPGIKKLQTLLKSRGYLDDTADGVYGVHTDQAVYRAKYWLGYLRPDHSASDLLLSYLSGKKKPNLLMRTTAGRRKAIAARRRKKNAGLTKGQKALQAACSQLGQKENPPDSNRSKFSLWYGLIGAWCAMFVTWCSVRVPYKGFKRGARYAYVPYMRNDAVAGRNSLMVTTKPRSGDIICFDWDHNGVADHTGFYADEPDLHKFVPLALGQAKSKFGNLGAGDFWTVEGNTGIGNDSNGGEVMIRKRNRSMVQTFIRAS